MFCVGRGMLEIKESHSLTPGIIIKFPRFLGVRQCFKLGAGSDSPLPLAQSRTLSLLRTTGKAIEEGLYLLRIYLLFTLGDGNSNFHSLNSFA